MSLDALVTEAGRALSAARRLFGAAPAEESLQLAQQVVTGRQAVAQAGQAATGNWQGGAAGTYIATNADQVQAFDRAVAADGLVGPALLSAGQAAAAGARNMDNLIVQTRFGVAALAPNSGSAGGQQELARYLHGQLNQANGLLQDFQQRATDIAATLRNVDYGNLTGHGRDSPAAPLDSHTWKPGDKRHKPYVAGRDGLGPPNYPGAPPWIEIGPRSGIFVRSDELPGVIVQSPQSLDPAPRYDNHGNRVPYVELGPNTGVWAPISDFPGAVILPPGSKQLPLYGYDEYLPGSGIFIWHDDLLPEPYNPYGPLGPPTQTYPQGGHRPR
uniref:ESX-1 secretion-associated protein EspA/EspE-like domain-containing protein n=1 Tax=Mycobacterium riyadhense TaxID=486698 RepID=A0A653F2G0_9MYCO|nr:hypothetical protein BIN_B_05276 [Mycobacterium riyadhense]